jgi:nanoRNase/pAp phosphatase (c-di-AMP/oligoRNAs hydrolase)
MPARLDDLARSLEGVQRLLILPHNDPDPDAIASALALRTLLQTAWPAQEGRRLNVEATIVYSGIIGRAENKALVRYLDRPLRRLLAADQLRRQQVPIALVDTQPGTGNNALPPGSAGAGFAEVRPDIGATSTILADYLLAAGIEPDPPLATALYYGIKSDTLGLMREAGPEDLRIYHHLQALIDVEALAEIENAQVPSDYFKRLDAALHTARVYDGVVLSYIGAMPRPDLAAELADLLLRLEGTRWAVCMGVYKDELIVSIRARSSHGGAGRLVQSIVGDSGTAGGHGTMAAGHLPLGNRDPEDLSRELSQQVLYTLGVRAEGKPLLDGFE